MMEHFEKEGRCHRVCEVAKHPLLAGGAAAVAASARRARLWRGSNNVARNAKRTPLKRGGGVFLKHFELVFSK